MKKQLLLLFIGISVCLVSLSQNHNAFKYQAVLRDSDGKIISEEEVGLRISILQGSESGNAIYSEEHVISTNSLGLMHLNVGSGTSLFGTFLEINWAVDDYFLQIELNRNSEGYNVMGVSPLLSVPYALHAENVTNKDDADADPENEIQDLNLLGSTLKITNNSNATEIDLAPFTGTNTDEQTLSIIDDSLIITNGNKVDLLPYKNNTDEQQLTLIDQELTISNGNSVDLSTLPDNIDDADADPENEIQDLNLLGSTLKITNNSNATEIDLAPFTGTNTDEQTLSIIEDSLAITNGNKVDLLPYKDNTDEQHLSLSGTELSIENGNIIDLSILPDSVIDDDADATNELQNLSITYDSILISDGEGIPLPNGLNLWTSDGTNILLPSGNLGLGTATPTGKLEVKGNAVDTPDDLLFGVMNNNGDTVFAVYQGGVRIYVDDSPGKAIGSRGGFAVGGYSSGKGGLTNEYLRVTPDSVRIYVDEADEKAIGSRGGFAVGGYSSGKGIGANEYLRVTPDSVRVYVDNATTKPVGSRGGFAVGGYSSGKGLAPEYLRVTADSTRIYVADAEAGFGVENTSSGNNKRLMKLTEENYFIGHQAGTNNNTGLYNTFLGYQSGVAHQTGNNNIYIGYQSAFNDESGQNNTFMGNQTGYNNTSGSENTFIGDGTGHNNTDGGGHVFIGFNAGYSNTSGDTNTFIGYKAGQSNTTGYANSFLGTNSGYSNINGNYNAFFGSYAGYSVIGHDTNPLYTGSYNAFFGSYAGYNTTVGFANVFMGPYSGYKNTTGRENVFVGLWSGSNNTTGWYNTFVGKAAGYENTTGIQSTFVGTDAGLKNIDGFNNSFFGASAGTYNTSGSTNTFIGAAAGYKNTTGTINTYVGAEAGGLNENGNGNIFIGNAAGYNETGSNRLYIDNSETTLPLIYGNFTDGFEQVEINGHLVVKKDFWVEGHSGGATAWNEPSDKRLKKNITTIPNALNRVKQLRGVNFVWKDSVNPESGKVKMGFIAQEAKEVIPEAVNKNDEYYSMQYASITAILVEAIKEQQQIIEKQQKENQEIKDKYTELEERLKAIENKFK